MAHPAMKTKSYNLESYNSYSGYLEGDKNKNGK
jgi:hypothetical protein